MRACKEGRGRAARAAVPEAIPKSSPRLPLQGRGRARGGGGGGGEAVSGGCGGLGVSDGRETAVPEPPGGDHLSAPERV